MKASMESTGKTLVINGMNFRVWEGTTEKGIPFVALVNRLESVDVAVKPAFISELMVKSREPVQTTAAVLERMGIVAGVPEGYGDKPSDKPAGPAGAPPTSTGA